MKFNQVVIVVCALTLLSCQRPYTEEGWATQQITQAYTFADGPGGDYPVEKGVTWSASQLNKGRHSYMHYCYACHGVNGDGKGPAAPGFRPPPRDFRKGVFKFGAVRSGELPSDEDLSRIIKGGLHGTPMLEWDIPDMEIERIVAFIKTFPPIPCDPEKDGKDKCDKEAKKYPDGKPNKWLETYTKGKKKGRLKPIGKAVVVPSKDPWIGKSNDAIAMGAEVYHLKAQCATCHPSYLTRADYAALALKVEGKAKTSFREGMYQGIVLAAKDNPYGVNLMPPDFTLNPMRSIRNGHEMPDLWRLIASGVGGVMPAWVDGLSAKEIWALSYYVKSLMDLALPAKRKELLDFRNKLNNQPEFVPPPPPAPEAKKVTIELDDAGQAKIGEDAFEEDQKLQDKVVELAAAGPLEVVIKTGEATKAERVVAIVDLVKAAGVKKIAMADGSAPPSGAKEEEDKKEDAVPEAPAVPVPTDGDVLGEKGKTRVPPTPVPEVKPPSVPKPPVGRPAPPAKPAPAGDPYE